MKIITKTLMFETKKEFEFIKITDRIERIVSKSKIKEGFLNIFSKHTTLSIEINEYEKLLLRDIMGLMRRIAPEKRRYFHDIMKLRKNCPPNEPKNAKGHLRRILLENSQIIPISDFKMQLGRFQDILAVETSGPRKREIIIQICGNVRKE